MPKAVFDSATLVSAFLTDRRLVAELLHQVRGGAFQLCLADEILDETRRVLLGYQRIRRRYQFTNEEVITFCEGLRAAVQLMTDLPHLSGVSRDPKDDMIIACALKARAQYLVTRDDDLLSLGAYRRIKMITPEAFSEFLRQRARRHPRR